MAPILGFFKVILYQPLFNALVFLYNIVPGHDISLAIILLTIIIKFILWPLSAKAIKSQKKLQELQPKLNALKEQYKDNKEELTQAIMKLYKEDKVNPLSSCGPLLIQFPFLIALFEVFRNGLKMTDMSSILYPFIHNPGQFNTMSLSINMAETSVMLAILVGIFQFWQTKMTVKTPAPKEAGEGAKDENMMAAMNKNMTYFMPLITVFIGIKLPAGLMLYWLATTILTIVQQKFLFKK